MRGTLSFFSNTSYKFEAVDLGLMAKIKPVFMEKKKSLDIVINHNIPSFMEFFVYQDSKVKNKSNHFFMNYTWTSTRLPIEN